MFCVIKRLPLSSCGLPNSASNYTEVLARNAGALLAVVPRSDPVCVHGCRLPPFMSHMKLVRLSLFFFSSSPQTAQPSSCKSALETHCFFFPFELLWWYRVPRNRPVAEKLLMGEKNVCYISGLLFLPLYIVSFYRNIIFALVGCTCTKTPVFFRHSLFSIFLNR